MAAGPIQERNQDATVYVGGLDEKVTDTLMWELFLQAGPVVNVHMPRDRITQLHQSYGFVEFMSEEDADYAIKIMNMIKFFGKPIRVNKAASNMKSLDVGANVFIGNLDPEIDEKLLYDIFSAFGVILQTPKIMRDPDTGNSKGFAFINYASFEASDAAMDAMNGQHLCNRVISVSYAFKKDTKGERHGSAAERLLAAQNPLSQMDRPHQMFADAPPTKPTMQAPPNMMAPPPFMPMPGMGGFQPPPPVMGGPPPHFPPPHGPPPMMMMGGPPPMMHPQGLLPPPPQQGAPRPPLLGSNPAQQPPPGEPQQQPRAPLLSQPISQSSEQQSTPVQDAQPLLQTAPSSTPVPTQTQPNQQQPPPGGHPPPQAPLSQPGPPPRPPPGEMHHQPRPMFPPGPPPWFRPPPPHMMAHPHPLMGPGDGQHMPPQFQPRGMPPPGRPFPGYGGPPPRPPPPPQ